MKNKKFVWLMGMVLALGTVSGCGSDKAADRIVQKFIQ